MRTLTDAHRSLRRWASVVFPEPWDVQPERKENLGRPSVVVVPIPVQSNTGSAYIRDVQRDFNIYAYPNGVEGDPGASKAEADAIAEILDRAITAGVQLTGGEWYSYSMRIPAFDYDGVPVTEGLPDGSVPYDFYPASNWDVDVRVDPDDDTLYTVLGSVRLRWRVTGDVRYLDGAVLQDVVITHP